MMNARFARLFVLPFMLLIAACQSGGPAAQTAPTMTFSQYQPWRLNVARVEIRSDFQPSLRAPNVEHEMPIPPARAAMQWAERRLQATGTGNRTMEFVVKNATVTETQLNRTPGVTGMFTTDQTERYDAALTVALIVRNERGFVETEIQAEARRFITLPENTTINQRELAWYGMVEALMGEINGQIEARADLLNRYRSF